MLITDYKEFAKFQSHTINEWGWSPKRVRTVKATISSLSNFIENILDDVLFINQGRIVLQSSVDEIREETVRYCYGVTINTGTERRQVIVGGEGHKDEYHDDAPRAAQGGQPQGNMPAQAPKEQKVQKPVTVKREEPKVGRNDPCPCGSGKKYKACCGK